MDEYIDGYLVLTEENYKSDTFRSDLMWVFPKMAKFLRKNRNINNHRPLQQRDAKRMAEDIKAGRWKRNGQTIGITISGWLPNGQHRCLAIEIADKPVLLLVVRGLEDDMDIFDTGRSRTLANCFRRRGHKNSKLCGGVALRIAAYRRGSVRNMKVVTHEEALLMLDLHEELLKSVDYVLALKEAEGCKVPLAPLGFAHWAFTQVDADKGALFFEQFLTGANLSLESPVLALRSRLLRSDNKFQNESEVLGILYKCWNAFVNSTTIKLAKWQSNESFPVFFGQAALHKQITGSVSVEDLDASVQEDIRKGILLWSDERRFCDVCSKVITLGQVATAAIQVVDADKDVYTIAHGPGECPVATDKAA